MNSLFVDLCFSDQARTDWAVLRGSVETGLCNNTDAPLGISFRKTT